MSYKQYKYCVCETSTLLILNGTVVSNIKDANRCGICTSSQFKHITVKDSKIIKRCLGKRCSGFGVFPDGTKCDGCGDCEV